MADGANFTVNVGALSNALAMAIQQAAGQGNQQAIPSPTAPSSLTTAATTQPSQ